MSNNYCEHGTLISTTVAEYRCYSCNPIEDDDINKLQSQIDSLETEVSDLKHEITKLESAHEELESKFERRLSALADDVRSLEDVA